MKPQIVAEPVVLRSSISKRWPKLAFVGKGCGIYKTCVCQISGPLMLTEKVSIGGQLPLLRAHYEYRSFSLASEKKNIQHQHRYAHLCPILIICGEWQLHSTGVRCILLKQPLGDTTGGIIFMGLLFCSFHHHVCWVVFKKTSSG